MPQFGPELSWTRSRPAVLGLVVAALLMLAAVAPSARAQEVPVALPADPGAPPAEQQADPGAPVEPPPVATDPAPQPEPVPVPPPEPSPPPEQPADPQPAPAFDEQPVADRPSEGSSGGRDSASHSTSPSFSPQPVATSVSAPSAPVALPPPETQLTAAPLGWDLYDDALFAESVDSAESAALAGGGPPSFGGLGVLGAMSRAIAHEKHRDAAAGSRPNATPAGGSGPGGGGPGPGQSMGLAGGGGGASAGIALLMLLGLVCGWSLLAPRDRRAFRTSTATWRPSAYVPPIEHPG